MIHVLKTWPEPFQAVWDGRKTCEVRVESDRSFGVGDELVLKEYDPDTAQYTGRELTRRVTHIVRAPFLPMGICAMSISPKSASGLLYAVVQNKV